MLSFYLFSGLFKIENQGSLRCADHLIDLESEKLIFTVEAA
jgi:hypothetical protein